MRGEGVDEQNLLARLRMRAHDRMLGVRELRLQGMALLDRHGRTKSRFDTVARAQACDLRLDVLGQPLVGQRHIGPHRVAADMRAFDAAQHAAKRRLLAPGRVGMPSILVAIIRLVGGLVDPHQTGVIGVASRYRMVFELAEMLRERDVFGAT